MGKRKAISKKNRFEIFKRDAFSCQYCGSTPPSAVLEIDHIEPVSKGGDNGIDNLITACFDCNRGKSNRLLSVVPESIEEKQKLLAEKTEQLKQYANLKKSIKARETRQINKIDKIFQETFFNRELTENTKSTIRYQFIPKLEQEDIELAMHLGCAKFQYTSSKALKYFFGICWRKIKGGQKYGSD